MKRFINATLFIGVIMTLLFTSCQKDASFVNPALPNAFSTVEAKLYYEQTVVVKEQDRNSKATSLSNEDAGIFKRMERLGKKVQWDNPQEFTNGKITYLAFSLNEKDRELRTGNKMHRTFIFSKTDGNIQMQICETMGTDMPTATILSQIKAALNNHEMQKISAVSSGSANLYFYNDSYRSDFSCRITNGNFENTAEAIKLKVDKGTSGGSTEGSSNSQTCVLWGCYLVWWENGVRHETLLYTYNVCTGSDESIEPEGDGGGGGGGEACDYSLCIADFENSVSSATGVTGVQVEPSGSVPVDDLDYEQPYPWTVVVAPSFSIKSIEIATLTKVAGNALHSHQFKSVIHTPLALSGFIIGGTAIISNDVASFIPGLYTYGVNVALTVKYSPAMCCGLPGPFTYDVPYSSQAILKAP